MTQDKKWVNAVGKNDADRLAWHRIARNCQLVKKKKSSIWKAQKIKPQWKELCPYMI